MKLPVPGACSCKPDGMTHGFASPEVEPGKKPDFQPIQATKVNQSNGHDASQQIQAGILERGKPGLNAADCVAAPVISWLVLEGDDLQNSQNMKPVLLLLAAAVLCPDGGLRELVSNAKGLN